MPRETTYIETTGDFEWFGAAKFLAVIIYPEDHTKRTDFVNACRAWMFKRMLGGQLKRRLVNNPDILKFSDIRKIDSQFNRADKILVTKRLPALNLFRLQLTSKAINVKIGEEKFCIDKWVHHHYASPQNDKAEEYNEKNFYRRKWSPSKPIIHLVLGLNTAIKEEMRPTTIEKLLINAEWLPEAVDVSEKTRKTIALLNVINITEQKQIQILPEEIT